MYVHETTVKLTIVGDDWWVERQHSLPAAVSLLWTSTHRPAAAGSWSSRLDWQLKRGLKLFHHDQRVSVDDVAERKIERSAVTRFSSDRPWGLSENHTKYANGFSNVNGVSPGVRVYRNYVSSRFLSLPVQTTMFQPFIALMPQV